MNRILLAAILLPALIFVAADAAEIYRETDANGRTVYSDRPTSAGANKLSIESRPTDPAAIEAERTRLAERQAKREESQSEAATRAERSRDIQAQRAENCKKAQAYKARVDAAHRLYTLDEKGDRSYYSAAEHDAALEKARAQIKEWCDN